MPMNWDNTYKDIFTNKEKIADFIIRNADSIETLK